MLAWVNRYVVPTHICPTVNLAEDMVIVNAQGRVEEVAPVVARAHETLLHPGANSDTKAATVATAMQ